MNERIKLLALRAEDYAFDESKKLESSVELVFSNRVFFKSFKEKFAELIVRECIDVVGKATASPNGYQALMKHFGVEE
jgi:hypothetical protein